MAHISGFERDQLLLLPEAVDDYVGADNPVRFIDAFVEGLDLTEAGFVRVQPRATGRPGYRRTRFRTVCLNSARKGVQAFNLASGL
jgi:transposase